MFKKILYFKSANRKKDASLSKSMTAPCAIFAPTIYIVLFYFSNLSDEGSGISSTTTTSLTYTLHSLLAFDVILQPTSDLSQLAGQLVVIMNVR